VNKNVGHNFDNKKSKRSFSYFLISEFFFQITVPTTNLLAEVHFLSLTVYFYSPLPLHNIPIISSSFPQKQKTFDFISTVFHSLISFPPIA
jgi:hypothetical protein